ncbi:MAG: hypothetical protein ABS904_00930 [Solibacillus isronensis]
MTYTTRKPKAQKELNFFTQQPEITTVDGGNKFVLTVPLKKMGSDKQMHQIFVQVSEETFDTYSDCIFAMNSGEFTIPKELKSYLQSMDVYANEGSPFSLSEDKVLQTGSQFSDSAFYIGVQMVEYQDDAPNIYSNHSKVSAQVWDTEEDAQQALDSGEWTRVNMWNLTDHYLESGILKVEYNAMREGYVYCREILYRNNPLEADTEIMRDYLECSPQSYLTPEQAQQALEDYLASI